MRLNAASILIANWTRLISLVFPELLPFVQNRNLLFLEILKAILVRVSFMPDGQQADAPFSRSISMSRSSGVNPCHLSHSVITPMQFANRY